MIDFGKMDINKEESMAIFAMTKRAIPTGNRLNLMMDLEACHAIACPLDLYALLQADDYNFFHDINGIVNYLDRNTGHLTNGFVPRFAKR